MSRGYPDYNAPRTAIGSVSFDSAELAARLGSLSKINRMGNVVYQESFENGLNGWNIYTGSNQKVEVVSSTVFEGGTCLKFKALDAINTYSHIFKLLPLLDYKSFGLEFTFGWKYSASGSVPFVIEVRHYQISKYYNYKVYIDPNNDLVRIYTLTGSPPDSYVTVLADIGSYIAGLNLHSFHTAKIVLDLENTLYKRMYFDQYSVDLSGYSPLEVPSGNFTCLAILIHTEDNIPVDYVLIDNLIATINEP